jgi:hypothetical protein
MVAATRSSAKREVYAASFADIAIPDMATGSGGTPAPPTSGNETGLQANAARITHDHPHESHS